MMRACCARWATTDKQGIVARASQLPAYMLHSLAYRETSLVIELWTREFGKVSALAKGARRPHSALRPVLLGFQPLLVSLTGRGEVRTLTAAEWVGGHLPPQGEALFAAYYLNELVMRGVLRDDPHPGLFDAYALAVARLASDMPVGPTVRHFELCLLAELGYGLDATEWPDAAQWLTPGHALMTDEQAIALRSLTREQLSQCMGYQPLVTRQWMEQLRKPA